MSDVQTSVRNGAMWPFLLWRQRYAKDCAARSSISDIFFFMCITNGKVKGCLSRIRLREYLRLFLRKTSTKKAHRFTKISHHEFLYPTKFSLISVQSSSMYQLLWYLFHEISEFHSEKEPLKKLNVDLRGTPAVEVRMTHCIPPRPGTLAV